MTTPTDILANVIATLKANLPILDAISTVSYLPMVSATKVGLVGVATGGETEVVHVTFSGTEYRHRLRLQLWIKLVQGQEVTANTIARDIGYQCMQVLIANDTTGGYELPPSEGNDAVMSYDVDRQVYSEGGQGYMLGTLTVSVWQYEGVE